MAFRAQDPYGEPIAESDFPPEAIRYSRLKRMGQSPMHYEAACRTPFAPTRAMHFGTLVHSIVLGGNTFVVWEGRRQGNDWKAFEAKHTDVQIATRAEFSRAMQVARAVQNDPVVREVGCLDGERELDLEWHRWGRLCRGRVDVANRKRRFVTDLKTCADASPFRFGFAAKRLGYPGQLEWYGVGVTEALGWEPEHHYIVAVESKPPHAVVVYRVTTEALEQGARTTRAWFEQLQVCEECDEWPGYSQCVVELEADERIDLIFGDEEDAA